MLTDKTFVKPTDFRLALYRFIRQLVIVVAVGAVIKLFLLDTVLIKTDEMAPTLLPGDRVVMVRLPFAPFFSAILGPGRHGIMTFANPARRGAPGCLRTAALSGDSILVADATLLMPERGKFKPVQCVPADLVLPADYSPRDQMAPLRIPGPGTTAAFDSLPMRNFMFCASLTAQENPEKRYTVDARLYVDGITSRTYNVTAFPLYKGPFDSIPDSLRMSWFFWDRLYQYLCASIENKRVAIQFQLLENNVAIPLYTFRKRHAFLIADNWVKGFDSRYFGPVCVTKGKGMVVGVLWSWGQRESGKKFLRWSRVMRIVQ